ncbi:hypothetical protein LCGC14_0204500 [marine sediment metagenome]|uniref:Uncharacterized protein n=1 Tax=marine sediment metagenome TaxID=412755 RepID=A0A0F9UYT8_9ZZZZ
MTAKKRTKVLVIVAVGLVAILGCVLWIELPRREVRALDASYKQIRRGMSESETIGIMGSAGTAGPGTPSAQAYWDDERLSDDETARIAKTLRYRVETFFLPITFEIALDEGGHVVGKHRYD